jgi:hypothetical protein
MWVTVSTNLVTPILVEIEAVKALVQKGWSGDQPATNYGVTVKPDLTEVTR